MITWIKKPYGESPIEAEGWFLGYYFYFRSKWNIASIQFAKDQDYWYDIDNGIIKEYILLKTKKQHAAGYISYNYAIVLIVKACIKFCYYLLKNKIKNVIYKNKRKNKNSRLNRY
jgi:hypothetical protein